MPILTHETLDMMILAAPVAVISLACLVMLLLLLRCHRSAVVVTIVTLILNGWTEQIPVRMSRQVSRERQPGTLRVLEYNICAKGEYYPIHDDSFIDYILGFDADVLFLPENTAGVVPHLEDTLKQLYPYSVHSFDEYESQKNAYCDYTLYCRYPLSNYRNYSIDNQQLIQEHPYLDSLSVIRMGHHFMAYEATANINGRDVTLLHVHMRSNSYDTAKTEAESRRGKADRIYQRLLMGYAFRDAEARAVADSLRDCPTPLLICGDFNDLSGSRSIRTMQDCRHDNVHPAHRDRLKDAWWEGGQGFGFTFADQHLRLRLDHILYSKEFKLQAVEVFKSHYSDHRPLVADFVLE